MKTLIVYTRPDCKYCTMAKDYLKNLDIKFTEINVAEDSDAMNMLLSNGHRSVPAIFADDKLLVPGGYTSLKSMRKNEILERLQ